MAVDERRVVLGQGDDARLVPWRAAIDNVGAVGSCAFTAGTRREAADVDDSDGSAQLAHGLRGPPGRLFQFVREPQRDIIDATGPGDGDRTEHEHATTFYRTAEFLLVHRPAQDTADIRPARREQFHPDDDVLAS